MKLQHKILILAMIAVFMAGACNLAAPAPSGSDATLAALSLQLTIEAGIQQTSAAGGDASEGGDGDGGTTAPTATLPPSNTPEPTVTPSPGIPMVSVSVATNCRRGPSTIFQQVGALLVGETAEVLGRRADNQYYVIRNPDGGVDCWLWAEYATLSGNINAIPVLTPPPTPTPTYTPTPVAWFAGSWHMDADAENDVVVTVTQNGLEIEGLFLYNGQELKFEGTVSGPDFKYASGTWDWDNGTADGTFEWEIRTNTNTFHGNGVTTTTPWEWCGWRSGSSKPSPCLWESEP
jgi:hypothetical protein